MKKNSEKETKETIKKDLTEKIGAGVAEELYREKKEKVEEEKFSIEKEKITKIIEEKLGEELEKLKTDPKLKEEVKKEVEQIRRVKKEGKIERLLVLAEEKGVAFAVEVARKAEDPFIVDAFHDLLVREGYYKKFLKK